MLLSAAKQLKIDPPWAGFEATRDGRQFIITAKPNHFRVLKEDFTARCEFTVGAADCGSEVSPDGSMLAVWKGNNLSIVGLDGQLIYHERGAKATNVYDHCLFSADRRFLWTVRHAPKYQVELQVRETVTWQTVRSRLFPEPAPPASLSLHAHPESKIMAVWAAAGQDGQWVYWAYDDGAAIQVYEAPQLEFTTPPAFRPDGSEFLVTQGECEERLQRYRFPDCTLLGSLEWTDEDEDHQIGGDAIYLSDRQALLDSNNGRQFLVDLNAMRIVDEVIFRGHEPRPTRELYPILKNHKALSTDVRWHRIVADSQLWTCHEHLPASKGTYSVILWNAASLFTGFTPLRTGAPYTSQLLQQRGWH